MNAVGPRSKRQESGIQELQESGVGGAKIPLRRYIQNQGASQSIDAAYSFLGGYKACLLNSCNS